MKESEVSHIYIDTMHRDSVRSPEANEMLERTPSRLYRWAAIAFGGLFLLLFLIGEFVRYPDTLDGSATITTDPLPIKLKTQSGGLITSLFVADGTTAQKNEVIAELENPTGYANIQMLGKIMDSVTVYLHANNDEALAGLIANPLQSLGDAQGFYNQLLQEISAKLLLQKEHLYKRRTQNLEQQIGNLKSISQISSQEKSMEEEELKQANERFNANEKLYKDKVISRQEYYDEAAKLRSKKLQLEQQNASIIQNSLSSGENNKQMLEIQYEHEDKERGFSIGMQEAMRNIANYIRTWRQRYLLISPFTGTIHYLRALQVNEPISAGDELFAIVPDKHKYLAIIMLPAAGIGKVQVGQNVHLMVDDFPFNEFGFLQGQVIKRSTMPETTGPGAALYRVYVQLPDTLETNYHKNIAFSPEMAAKAHIITKDRSLLQRMVSAASFTSK